MKKKVETPDEIIKKHEKFPRQVIESIKEIPSKLKKVPQKITSKNLEETTEKILKGASKGIERVGKEVSKISTIPEIQKSYVVKPTPKYLQQIGLTPPQPTLKRKKENMWSLVGDKGFIYGSSPFDSSSPFDNTSPFFPRKRKQR